MKSRIVHNKLPYGVLVWMTPEGILADSEGNVLSMEAEKGDLNAVKKMREAAKGYGFEEGHTVFLPGRRKINEKDHEQQMEALEAGEPLPFDIPDEAFNE